MKQPKTMIYPVCQICNQMLDKRGRYATEYVKTKRKTEVFFHYSCYESIADHKRRCPDDYKEL